jgi:phospholipase C
VKVVMPAKSTVFLPIVTNQPPAAPAPKSNPQALAQINHIVVVMMENRSFDHMLGYLSLEGGRRDVDGLRPGMQNVHDGKVYPIHHETRTALPHGLDPRHGGADTDEQLDDANGGFVRNIARAYPKQSEYWPTPMGHYNARDLPTYDFLAREFTVCDRWFASVPGATYPNRLYAFTGGSDGKREHRNPPIYNRATLVRHLDAARVSWHYYFHDLPLLATYDWSNVPALTRLRPFAQFVADAARGRLPAVSWVEPNFFKAVGPLDHVSNDDHPPSDVMMGQSFVHSVYAALAGGPQWGKTLLIVTYDEHGGFFDHVPPPACDDDLPHMRRYGVRVPAFVVSPLAGRGKVCHAVFDHTSIAKTILNRFCKGKDGQIPHMGARVAAANDLSLALMPSSTRSLRPRAPANKTLAKRIARWDTRVTAAANAATRSLKPPLPNPMHDFQRDLMSVKPLLIERGLIKPATARTRR